MVKIHTCLILTTLATSTLGAVIPSHSGNVLAVSDYNNEKRSELFARALNPSKHNSVQDKVKPSSGSSEEAPATKQAPRKEAPRKEAPKKPTKQRPGQGSSTQDGKAAGPRINRGGNGAPQPNEPAKTRKANKSPAQEPEEVSGKDQKPQGKSKFGKNGKFPSPGPKQDPREKKQPTDDGMRGSESAAKEAPAKGKPKERPGNSEARKQPEPQQRNQKPRTKKEVSTKKPQEDPAPAAEDGNDGPTTESFKWYKGSEKTPTNYVQDTKSSWVSKFKGKYVPEEEESE